MQNRYWLLIAPILFVLSCKSGEKLYNKGRYDDAVKVFVKKLQKKPQNTTAVELLPKAYEQSKRAHEDQVNGHLASNNPLKWEYVRQEYRSLQNLYDIIHSSPAALAIVTPKDYRTAITGAQENAAEVRYERGVDLLEKNDKASARRAYDEFAAALSILPNYRNSAELRDESFNRGVVNVIVSEMQISSSYFQFSADQFRDVLIRNLQSRNVNRFVQFTDERIARNNNLQADEYLELRFYDFVVGQTYVDRSQRDVSKEIVTGTYKDTSGKVINKYETVKATIYTTRASVISKGLLDYRLIEVSNSNVISTNRLPGSYTWVNEFGSFKGDKRALSEEDKKLIGGTDIAPPPPQELFMLFTRPIYDQLTRDMQTLYNNL
jgi:tetratricopeptide (TPR) repeat protein